MSFIKIVTVTKKVVGFAAAVGGAAIIENIAKSHSMFTKIKPAFLKPFVKFAFWAAGIGLGYIVGKIAERGINELFDEVALAISNL